MIINSTLLVCYYVPPATSWCERKYVFSELLIECKDVISLEFNCSIIVVLGDFNTGDMLYLQNLVDLFQVFGLDQVISTSTHKSGGFWI
jgi:hypothetical protein